MGDHGVTPAEDVQLWWASLAVRDGELARLRCLLDRSELARADRLRVPDARRRFIAARATLRMVLALHTGIRPEHIRFTLGTRGKPRLADGVLHFNTSDSGDWVVVAVAAEELGVDLEVLRPLHHPTALAERICTEQELESVLQFPEEQRDAALLRLWTCKEAGLKAIGVGLSGGLRSVEIDLWGPGGSPRLIHLCGDSRRWQLQTADPQPEVLCTVVLPRGSRTPAMRQLEHHHN
jgi:4'-phosphopantetheinyl transferase